MRRTLRCGFTLVELLVVILIISVLARFLVPAVFTGRRRVTRAECLNHLRSLAQLATAWADDNRGWLPVARGEEPRAYESFQLLVDEIKGARNPRLYVCPASQDVEAEVIEEGGPFELGEENVSYAWRNWRLRTSGGSGGRTAIGCDDSIANPELDIRENHDDGINVAYLDSSVEWKSLKDLKKTQAYQDGGLEEWLAVHKLGK